MVGGSRSGARTADRSDAARRRGAPFLRTPALPAWRPYRVIRATASGMAVSNSHQPSRMSRAALAAATAMPGRLLASAAGAGVCYAGLVGGETVDRGDGRQVSLHRQPWRQPARRQAGVHALGVAQRLRSHRDTADRDADDVGLARRSASALSLEPSGGVPVTGRHLTAMSKQGGRLGGTPDLLSWGYVVSLSLARESC